MTGSRLLGLTGKVLLRITGACPEDCLYGMTLRSVSFSDYRKEDELTATVVVPLAQLKEAQVSAKKAMCTLETVKIYGAFPLIKGMELRAMYMLVLILLVFAVLFMQKHIWFIGVEGNTTIPEEQILQILDEHGVGFWTNTDKLDINLLKNDILAEIPELGFITVNTEGGMATVVVRQREEKPTDSKAVCPANITAKKSGIVTEITATGGTPQVAPGSIVTEGQLLISGVTNLDKTLLVTRAEGEIYARTFTGKTAILPKNHSVKEYTGRETVRISVTYGKNTINLYKSSGISYDNYDKMTDRNTLTLPGGYALPLTVTVVRFREYKLSDSLISQQAAEALLLSAVRNQLMSQMAAGEILKEGLVLKETEALYCLGGVVECREEIGSVVEIME